MCLFCFMYMLVCMLVCWVCEGAGSFAGACPSLAIQKRHVGENNTETDEKTNT